jgi:hypothetical protein
LAACANEAAGAIADATNNPRFREVLEMLGPDFADDAGDDASDQKIRDLITD